MRLRVNVGNDGDARGDDQGVVQRRPQLRHGRLHEVGVERTRHRQPHLWEHFGLGFLWLTVFRALHFAGSQLRIHLQQLGALP